MKIKIVLFFAFLHISFFDSFAQKKIEILLIGTSHNYELKVENDFDYVKKAVRKFKPDIFCTEYLSQENESKAVIENYYGERFTKRRDLLVAKNLVQEKELPKIIRKNYKILSQKPDEVQTRMDLAHALYLNEDLGNAHFQVYQLINTKLNDQDKEHLQKTFDIQDSLFRYTCRKNNEYTNIVFPLAIELKIDKLHGFDCQRFENPWNEAWGKSDSLFTVFEENLNKDTTNIENKKAIKTIAQFMKEYLDIQKKLRASYQEGTQNKFANTKDFDDLAEWGDFLRDDIYQLKGFPVEAYQEKRKYWLLRNEQMVLNTLKLAQKNKADKVVIFVGASHRRILQEMFEKNPNVTLKTIDQI